MFHRYCFTCGESKNKRKDYATKHWDAIPDMFKRRRNELKLSLGSAHDVIQLLAKNSPHDVLKPEYSYCTRCQSPDSVTPGRTWFVNPKILGQWLDPYIAEVLGMEYWCIMILLNLISPLVAAAYVQSGPASPQSYAFLDQITYGSSLAFFLLVAFASSWRVTMFFEWTFSSKHAIYYMNAHCWSQRGLRSSKTVIQGR